MISSQKCCDSLKYKLSRVKIYANLGHKSKTLDNKFLLSLSGDFKQ